MTNRYANGKIYKLVSDKTDDIYIGSCITTLAQRLYNHRKKNNTTSSKKLFELGAKVQIILIEEYPTDSRKKLMMRERFHIENNKCINKMRRPVTTDDEKYDYVKDYQTEYCRRPEVKQRQKEHHSEYYHKPEVKQRHNHYMKTYMRSYNKKKRDDQKKRDEDLSKELEEWRKHKEEFMEWKKNNA
jgi:hypothetical protein